MKRRIIFGAIAVLLVGVLAFVLFFQSSEQKQPTANAYAEAVSCGYRGTQEAWIAALVGETVPGGESAYEIAKQNGYSESYERWMNSLTGTTTKDSTVSAYVLAQQNGYAGTLSEWLTSLVTEPEKLGHSENGSKTDYELACEYGFQGTYIEWMVSLVSTTND